MFTYDLVCRSDSKIDQPVFELVGADEFVIDEEGRLIAETACGRLVQESPHTFSMLADGSRIPVPSRFRKISDTQYGFSIGDLASSDRFVIDPEVLVADVLGKGFFTNHVLGSRRISTGGSLRRE